MSLVVDSYRRIVTSFCLSGTMGPKVHVCSKYCSYATCRAPQYHSKPTSGLSQHASNIPTSLSTQRPEVQTTSKGLKRFKHVLETAFTTSSRPLFGAQFWNRPPTSSQTPDSLPSPIVTLPDCLTRWSPEPKHKLRPCERINLPKSTLSGKSTP